MARPLRIEFPGALYHVTSRGNGRADMYLDHSDRQAFLDVLGEVCSRMQWVCYAYCLMTNHYHLVVETQAGNLAKGMRRVNGVYTQRFNRRHGRVGHVLQGRYKAILVDREPYLLELVQRENRGQTGIFMANMVHSIRTGHISNASNNRHEPRKSGSDWKARDRCASAHARGSLASLRASL